MGSAGLNYYGTLCETECVGHSLGMNKDNNYSRDKRGAYGSAGPTAADALQWSKAGTACRVCWLMPQAYSVN